MRRIFASLLMSNIRIIRNVVLVLWVLYVPSRGLAQKEKLWRDRVLATHEYMMKHMYNAGTQNFARRADQANMPGSDAWGITIVLDAYAHMVHGGLMKPEELKKYYQASTALYERTGGKYGARILARQGTQTYIGGDDDLQWTAALMSCYDATLDSEYLNAAKFAFNALVDQGFWIDGVSKGWAWNSADRRPNGVSTAYGALAAARLYVATKDDVYRQWTIASLNALNTPQVGFFPRDMMVAAEAAYILYGRTKDESYVRLGRSLAQQALSQAQEVMAGKRKGELNPTDIGDLAEELLDTQEGYNLINFFVGKRTTQDIAEHGFYSRYDNKGNPVMNGSYLGVPLAVPFLPEVAEMLKLFAAAYLQVKGK
jgi:hypothetical protein